MSKCVVLFASAVSALLRLFAPAMNADQKSVCAWLSCVGWSLPNTLVAQQSRQWAADDAAAIATAKAGAKPREAADAIANATLIFCGPPISVGS